MYGRQTHRITPAIIALCLLASVQSITHAQHSIGRVFGGDVFSGSCDSCQTGYPAPFLGGSNEVIYDNGMVGSGDEGVIYDDSGYSCGSCGDPLCDGCGLGPRFSFGIEFTFLTPHFENNVAFTQLDSDGATTETFTETQFDHGNELAPRIWLEFLHNGPLGMRVGYWQYDENAAGIQASPPANGFGRISHPEFGTVDLSTTVPGSTFAANSSLNAYNIDFEGTKAFDCGSWGWMASAGLRYAEVDQSYSAVLTNANQEQQGNLRFAHRVQGIGPTISVRTQRPFGNQLSLFGVARGSLLFGDGEMTFNATEDQDLANQLVTQSSSARDDILPIGEVQVGLQFTPNGGSPFCPYAHLALEGQLWGGAGNASSESGNLGFYGFNFALGYDW